MEINPTKAMHENDFSMKLADPKLQRPRQNPQRDRDERRTASHPISAVY